MTLSLAFIEGIGGPELMMIMFVVLLLFGANRLPELARGIGKSVREFKKAASGVEDEVRRAMGGARQAGAQAPWCHPAGRARKAGAADGYGLIEDRPAVEPPHRDRHHASRDAQQHADGWQDLQEGLARPEHLGKALH